MFELALYNLFSVDSWPELFHTRNQIILDRCMIDQSRIYDRSDVSLARGFERPQNLVRKYRKCR